MQYYIELELQAVLHCQKLLSKLVQIKYKLDYIPILIKDYLNQKRYCIVKYLMEDRQVSFLVIFRTQKFHAFGTIYLGRSCDGETVNKEDYEIAKNKGVIGIVYNYAVGNEVKFISIKDFERLKKEGQIKTHINNADGKEEWTFPCDLTKCIGEYIIEV